jgi:hypothetical protein
LQFRIHLGSVGLATRPNVDRQVMHFFP